MPWVVGVEPNKICPGNFGNLTTISFHRPGFGRSTAVEPSLRLPVWLETVPVLMRTINARHISLCAHSCGVIYALNTIYSMPWILPPSNRKLYLFSPWVTPDHSGITYLSVSSNLPSSLINNFDTVIRFVNKTVMPTVQFSGMIAGAVSAPFSTPGRSPSRFKKYEHDDLCHEYCGVSAAERAAQNKVLMRCVFSESIHGANHEVLLLLRKEVAGSWGPLDSYDSYPDALEAKIQEHYRQSDGLNESANTTSHQFTLKTFWAEKDMLIGKKGAEYFDKCFQHFAHNRQSNSCLSYESEVVPDTDHDTLFLPQNGVLSRVLQDILEGTR